MTSSKGSSGWQGEMSEYQERGADPRTSSFMLLLTPVAFRLTPDELSLHLFRQ